MGVEKHRCEQCNSWFYTLNGKSGWKDPGKDDRDKAHFERSGIHEGSYNTRFCSKKCADEWSIANPGKSTKTLGARATLGCLGAVIKIPVMFCKLCWKIIKNKWTWTVCSCGLSIVAWKMLNAIYAPKDGE